MKNSAIFIALLFAFQKGYAHPVAYKDATAVMTWNQAFLSDHWIAYSFRSDMALVARAMRLETPEGTMNFYAPQFDYLVKRWNQLDSQANIYIYGSYGAVNYLHETKGAGLGGIQIDAEDRKYYAAIRYERMWMDDIEDMDIVEARIGVAPYEAEFNEIASWFMIQYQRHPMLTTEQAVTPLIRLFYRSVLFEAGVSTSGDWMTNFMFHF